MIMKGSKGLTLIELLVVLAIISLLSSIILVGLMSAQEKARDSAIMELLSQIRLEGQMILVESGAYNNPSNALCSAGNVLNTGNINHPLLEEIADKVKSYNGGTDAVCFATDKAYCVSSLLNLAQGFCVDSDGQATTLKYTCDGNPIPACE